MRLTIRATSQPMPRITIAPNKFGRKASILPTMSFTGSSNPSRPRASRIAGRKRRKINQYAVSASVRESEAGCATAISVLDGRPS